MGRVKVRNRGLDRHPSRVDYTASLHGLLDGLDRVREELREEHGRDLAADKACRSAVRSQIRVGLARLTDPAIQDGPIYERSRRALQRKVDAV